MFIRWLDTIKISDIDSVGGKNASLGEMYSNLSSRGIQVPNGFAVTTEAYINFMNFNKLYEGIQPYLDEIKRTSGDIESLRRNAYNIRALIKNGEFPNDIHDQIVSNYILLSRKYTTVSSAMEDVTDVAVRSSSTAEDLQDASFAGQQETYLNVRGKQQVIESIKNCFASLYTDRAISYRHSINYHGNLKISVCVQKMVRSDLGAAGVAFSLDTESGFPNVVIINGSFGLGELVVQGGVKPDEFIVFKPTLKQGYSSIIDKKMGDKTRKMVYGNNPDEKVKIISMEDDQHQKFCIDNETVILLSKWVVEIEEYFTKIYGKWTPVDTEWAYDGITKQLFIVQARPETVHSNKKKDRTLESYKLSGNRTPAIVTGVAVGDRISTGVVRIIHSLDNRYGCSEFNKGDVLVTDMTDPDWEPIMVKASAIITNKGGRTCHAAIIARELGINAVVGTSNCTEILKTGQTITASCAEGEIGYVR